MDRCLEEHKGDCRGEVAWHSLDPGRAGAFPRCDRHWEQRLKQFEGSIEQEALSPIPPVWFDPEAAGERWDEDY